MSSYHSYQDTLATGWVTGKFQLTSSRSLITPLSDPANYPADWVSAMEIRLMCDSAWFFSSTDTNGGEIPGPVSLWIPISVINVALDRLFVRQSGGSGANLHFIVEGKTKVGSFGA